jgi:hypothetical protein
MVTKKASGKKRAAKKVARKLVARKAPKNKPSTKKAADKYKPHRTVIMPECGGLSFETNGNSLMIQADENVSLDIEIGVTGAECRSAIRCRIVNGQWEC